MTPPLSARTVQVSVLEDAPSDAWLIAPRPFGHWNQRMIRFEASGATALAETCATNSQQHAYLICATGRPCLSWRVERSEDAAPDWVWQIADNSHTLADAGLQAQAAELCCGAPNERAALRAILETARGMFAYDHPEERFTAGHDTVPALCGTTKGSCVDINTFVLAAARTQGLTGQYIAGYWFGPGRTTTPDMHCWLAFHVDGQLEFWDVAHHLKWGVEGFGPGLNPAGGRRIGMSCGRGLTFDTPLGAIAISHFSEPFWVLPGGETRPAPIRIDLEEEPV
ncbi:MAG: transglutaminase-like domain-containing protein [Pseudomonadota bacterium]